MKPEDSNQVEPLLSDSDSSASEPMIEAFAEPSKPKGLSMNVRNILMVSGATLFIGSLVGGVLLLASSDRVRQSAQEITNNAVQTDDTPLNTTATEKKGLQLDTTKAYGDKYADGILPVGDEEYATSGPAKGKVYLCKANFVPDEQAGATSRGPWFIGTTKWNIKKKAAVSGSVSWEQKMANAVANGKRTISTNNLPDHRTGIFPVAANDPAYQYDRNPNTISVQSLTYELDAEPTYGEPTCMGGEAGIMLTGVAVFNAFDAGGRDAGAWEVQDACQGHPQGSGIYHYHTLSSCIKDVDISTVIGFALDGFPITGPKVDNNSYLTTDDLDECHGLTSEISLDGKKVTNYHYVMTQDFPYSVSCFRGTAIQAPGQHTNTTTQSQQKLPPGGQQPPRP